MELLHIESKNDTPEIIADGDNGIFEITGKSLPEDAFEFYKPLEDYVKEYLNAPQPNTVINLRPVYLNSSSTKKILDIIQLFERLNNNGYDVVLNWINTTDDDDIVEEGVEFDNMTTLHINFSNIE